MSDIGHLDFETYSELDIRKVGGYRYARHQSTEVLIACYWLPGMTDPAVWLPRTQPPPKRLMRWIEEGRKLGAHNVSFERNAWRYALKRMHPGIPLVDDKQWVCTAAKAAASGLPRSLDGALKALGTPVTKDAEGSKLITVFCKPRKPTKKDPRTRILPEQDERFQRFIQYCQQDVRGEMELDVLLPDLVPREQTMFRLDMVMNDRGIPIDIPLVKKAITVVQSLEKSIAARVQNHTKGIKATQVAKMLEYLSSLGLELENMQAETVRQALKDEDLDPHVRELLELRVEAGKASTKKLLSMLLCADPEEHIVQGSLLYHGAHTGRYAGRLIQPQNFVRGLLNARQRAMVFALLEHEDPDLFDMLVDGAPFYDDKGKPLTSGPIDAISQCMRGFIKAPRGYELAVVDYTAIEARLLAWIADEQELLDAFFQGLDVYKVMAVKLYKLKSINDVTDEQRRISKNLVLGCGYQLGGKKFVDYAAKAGVIITEEFAVSAVKGYRKSVPNIVASWSTVEKLVVAAILHPGKVYEGLKCKFYMRQHWLCIQLPSGREIRYPYARAVPCEKWGKPSYEISFRTEMKGQFLREKTYGGKLIENIVQGIARDVMMEGMLAAENNGYPVLGTVHDELITLRKIGTTAIKELEGLICRIRSWMKGMPLAAKGAVCIRYEKA